MKFGINLVPVRPEELGAVAVRAEALGYESLWVGEHVVVPFEPVTGYPGGRMPFQPRSRFVEPFTTIGYLAALTSTVRLGTGILILPLHEPHTLARAIATADVLSGGRLSLGLGVGWMRDEFDACGQSFENRGARADEMLAMLGTLFGEDEPSYDGKHYSFPRVGFDPKPTQQPHPPFLVGGSSTAALRRAATLGDGWYGTSDPPEVVAEHLARMREWRRAAGRGEDSFEVTALLGWGQQYDEATVAAYADAGVDRLVATPWSSSREALTGIEAFASAAAIG
jgi:probable F420-dependent oxidoreductase